jgi:hypothetical protein
VGTLGARPRERHKAGGVRRYEVLRTVRATVESLAILSCRHMYSHLQVLDIVFLVPFEVSSLKTTVLSCLSDSFSRGLQPRASSSETLMSRNPDLPNQTSPPLAHA